MPDGPRPPVEGGAHDAPLSHDLAEFTPRLRALAASFGYDDAGAEDLAQETLLRALGAQQRFARGTNLKAWLFTILRNLHLNRRRDGASGPQIVPFEDLGSGAPGWDRATTDVERQVLARGDLAAVVAAFRSLAPAFAVPLYLAAVEDLAYGEVAAILDIPLGTVMSRIYRARRMLLARLAETAE